MIVVDYAKFREEHEKRSEEMTSGMRGQSHVDSQDLRPQYSGSHISVESPKTFTGAKWPGGMSQRSPSGMVMDHRALRLQARTKYHDSIQARALVDRFADTVIDIGLKLEPAPMAGMLGIEPEFAEEWAKEVAERHHLWAMSKGATRSETMNWYQAQRLAETSQQRDGDYFARIYYNKRRDLLSTVQVQFIEPDQIVGDGFTPTSGMLRLNDGIVRDEAGREIAYKVQKITQSGEYKVETVPAYGPRSRRRFFIHGFQPLYAGQGRGFSRLSHDVQEFENITDLTSAEIKKAINQSNLTMFIQPSKENPASNPWASMMQPSAAPIQPSSVIGANPTNPPAGETPIPFEENLQWMPLPEAMNQIPGSVAMANLQQGEKVVPFESTAPSADFDKFVDHFTTHLSASHSMPVEVLLMKFGANYSASRGALILFWRIAQIWRFELQSDLLCPVYEMWLAEEIAAGRVAAPGWQDPRLRAAWLNANWWGAPMPIIDPLKAMKSDKGWAEMGAHDLDAVARNLNGSDGAMNRAKLKRQFPELDLAPWVQKTEG